MLLRGAQRRHTRLRRQEVPARLQRPLEWPQPPPPLLECVEPLPLEELELPLPEWPSPPPVVPEGLPTVPEGPSSPPVVPEVTSALFQGKTVNLRQHPGAACSSDFLDAGIQDSDHQSNSEGP
ncbi:UNVERIFIED_CONTAM: hypothetical protein FKN15_029746 [Acipenser sinensis]